MKAVILAAGEGSRLRPFTETRPKVMLPVANRPILEYKVRALSDMGVDDLVMVVGYRREKVQSYFEDGDEWDVDITYVVQEEQLGTAHAVESVREEVGDRFLVINGDNLVHPDAVRDLIDSVEGGNGVLVKRAEVDDGYGAIASEGGLLTGVEEKPSRGGTREVNLGVYAFTDEVFDAIDSTELSVRGEYEITASIQKLVDVGREVRVVETDATWMDAVYPWDLVRVNGVVLEGEEAFNLDFAMEGRVEEGAVVRGPVSVGEGTVIRSGAYVAGPCVVGRNSDIGPGAAIMPSTSVGENVSVGPGAVVGNSVLMRGVRVGSSSSVEGCVVGEGVRLGSHFVSEAGASRVEVKERLHRIEGIGGMIADRSRIGGNVTMSPGRVVGRECEVLPGAVVRDDLDSGSRLSG
ncbi:MAG: Bifunctional protein GlmU [Methanonatronarchaeales archaeon]|nr:Bifunctional protein GlmU [Methanonatronarchaeales archaeon]